MALAVDKYSKVLRVHRIVSMAVVVGARGSYNPLENSRHTKRREVAEKSR